MRSDQPPVVRLSDYRPSDHLCDRIELDVRLRPTAATVECRMALRPNPAGEPGAPLRLDGDELLFRGLLLDGEVPPEDAFKATPQGLILHRPPERPFTLTILTEVNPTANTKLMGLYRSGGVYCTQCEADGFRRIAYSLDRPDVLSVYTTRIEADRDEAPVLLGNGDLAATGEARDGRHFALWHDPFPKPSYLFAIVAGRLGRVSAPFTTMGGREVELSVWVEPGKEDRAGYALDALRRAMLWDERAFGREYDLSVFNVVAVPDFNMGAMENKGLNIFNDKYVLASPATATDADYAHIEAIVAHEYFHNWTGNRITCRDWFQLCLKEGLTVFRDQEFTADERSRAVARIDDVRVLRARQFSEDAGPLSHPVRPKKYREINNFYTATVYEKGAEVVRMLRLLLGPDAFARGMTRFFETCDGAAATVEDFLAAFAAESGRDLGPFARWYDQAGTPTLSVRTEHDAAAATFRVAFAQARPGRPEEAPLTIPIALGLVSRDGGPVEARCDRVRPDGVFVLEAASDEIVFSDVRAEPVLSVLRGFSAPVALDLDLPDRDLLLLLGRDDDPFNRWRSGQTVAMRLLLRAVRGEPDEGGADALAVALASFLDGGAAADPAFAALVLSPPGEGEIAQEVARDVDPDAIRAAREGLRATLGSRLAGRLLALRDACAADGPYAPDAESAGRRGFRNAALDLLAAGDPALGERLAAEQASSATNMTDRMAALATLSRLPGAARERALDAFAAEFAHEPLALDKWFSLQASIPEEGALARVRGLMAHPAFSLANPNRVRALVGAFATGNPTQFHRPDGSGYDFVAEAVLSLNGANPQVAARLLTAFSAWRTMEGGRRGRAEAALRRVAEAPRLSPDVADIVGRSLAEP